MTYYLVICDKGKHRRELICTEHTPEKAAYRLQVLTEKTPYNYIIETVEM